MTAINSLADSLHARAFLPLPEPLTSGGATRRTGVEIEFGGLDETATAEIITDRLGGSMSHETPHDIRVTGTRIGDVRVVLDTMFRDKLASSAGGAILDAARAVVPVEITTAPLEPGDMVLLDDLRDVLRGAGATGTGRGVFLGFGVHLNPELPELTAKAVAPVLLAFALLEDWLRHDDPIDASRRLLPFVEPYPRPFIDRLAQGALDWPLDRLMDEYVAANPTRNRSLDLLALVRHIDPERVEAALGGAARAVKPRPTWHYRLPDCRIDEPGWSLAQAWNGWRLVECVAADSALLGRLAKEWLAYRGDVTTMRRDWRLRVDERLKAAPDPVAGVAA